GPLEFSFGAQPIPIVVELDVAHRRMSLSQRVIERKRLGCRRSRSEDYLGGRQSPQIRNTLKRIALRESSVGESVIRICGDRLLKVFAPSAHILRGPLTDQVTALEIALICLCIVRVAFGHSLSHLRRYLRPQLV